MKIRWVQFQQDLSCSNWSYNFYKPWFTYRLGAASKYSQEKAGCLLELPLLLAVMKSSYCFPSSMRLSKITLFQLFLLSFLDFAPHSLRFIKCFTENTDAKCWAFLNIPFLWDVGSLSPGHCSGSITQLYNWKR